MVEQMPIERIHKNDNDRKANSLFDDRKGKKRVFSQKTISRRFLLFLLRMRKFRIRSKTKIKLRQFLFRSSRGENVVVDDENWSINLFNVNLERDKMSILFHFQYLIYLIKQ